MAVVKSHARAYRHAHLDGRCDWAWIWEDVVLACDDQAIPGGRFCAEHLIEAAARGVSEKDGAR